MRVSEDGGSPVLVAAHDDSTNRNGYTYPEFLPDGRHFLFLSPGTHKDDSLIFAAALDSPGRSLILSGNSGPHYLPSGHLLFLRGTTLMVQPFDAVRLLDRNGHSLGKLADSNLYFDVALAPDGQRVAGTPIWFPDGKWIAYESAGEVWRKQVDGSADERLTATTSALPGSWSPNGQMLAPP
jgi:hypothetical protein